MNIPELKITRLKKLPVGDFELITIRRVYRPIGAPQMSIEGLYKNTDGRLFWAPTPFIWDDDEEKVEALLE